MKRLPTPAASGKSDLTPDGAYRPTGKCCVAHVLGACSCSQHPCAFAAHAERSHEQPVSCPISYKTKNFDDINLSMALIQRYESDTDFFSKHPKTHRRPLTGPVTFCISSCPLIQVASGSTV